MLTRFFGSKIHHHMHLLGLFGLAFGIPMNKVVMSISMMFLALNLILEADISTFWKNLKSNKIFLGLLAFFILHVIGILWSNDLEYALHDLRAKLPLFVVPTVIVARPSIQRNELHFILGTFVFSTLLVSLINFSCYQHWIGSFQYDDIRGMSLFSSHVRFAIVISMSVGILLYALKHFKQYRVLILLTILWFTFYTYYSQVISGFTTLMGVFIFYIVYLLWGNRKKLAITFMLLIIIGVTGMVIWLLKPIEIDQTKYSNLPEFTTEGNRYYHDLGMLSPETGKPFYIYLCEEELRRDWPLRSKIPYDGVDIKGQPIRFTLLRFLSSKDLHKDAEGLASLTNEEIELIEQGIGTVRDYGVFGRLFSIKYDIVNQADPNPSSLLRRLEYWKTGWTIFKDHPFIGVGTGDVQQAFNEQYDKNNSPLSEENRSRTHQMFLTIALTFGIPGLILFLLFQGQFIVMNLHQRELVALLFIAIALISFLMEDTLETQTGVTFYALFFALFSKKIPDKKSAAH